MDDSKLFVYWGFNAKISSPHNFFYSLKLRQRKGSKIFVVDVRNSETVRKADVWLKPRFGTDMHLALGIANYMIEHFLYDAKFVEEYTYGFETFAKYVKKFSLEYVEAKTGISKREITQFAEEYARLKPSIIFIGYGLQRRYGGGETVRAISLLPALAGVHRGFYYGNVDGLKMDLSYLTGSFLGKPSRVIPQSKVGEFISKGEFKFVYIHLVNPAATHPNADRIIEGLLRDDVFVVVHETHWSETAKFANVVLPAPTWLEKDDFIFSYWHNYGVFNRKLFEPKGDAISERDVMVKIAERLGIENEALFEQPLDALRRALSEKVSSQAVEGDIVEIPYRKLDEYQTSSGKIEFYCRNAEVFGVDPLPKPVDLPESGEYPLILITSSHPLYTHTQFEEIYGYIPPKIFTSKEDAIEYGLNEGDQVRVESVIGSVLMEVGVDDSLPQGICFAYKSAYTLDGKRISFITNDDVSELGGATINTTFVRLIRVDGK